MRTTEELQTAGVPVAGRAPRGRPAEIGGESQVRYGDGNGNAVGGGEPRVAADPPRLEELERHARKTAAGHRLAARPGPDRLRARTLENLRLLDDACRSLGRAVQAGREIAPAGVWLLENQYLIREQVRTVRRQLSPDVSRHLPRLGEGPGLGLPRVYGLAAEFIGHVDGNFDYEGLDRFTAAYQAVSALKLGELWALPLMLRAALLESLAHAAQRIACQENRRRTEELREQRAAAGLPPGSARRHGTAREATADRVAMSNRINSLRMLGALAWRKFVEGQSEIERILREDPAGAYARMTFASRDHYRQAVETLARRSPLGEAGVARAAVEQARGDGRAARGPDGFEAAEEWVRHHHVGDHLIGGGRRALERKIGYRPGWSEAVRRTAGRWPLGAYVGAILLVWLLAVLAAAAVMEGAGATRAAGRALATAILAAFALAAGQFAVKMVNWLSTLAVVPRPTMKLDFSAGIPAEHRTLVAVPSMLTDEPGVRSLIEQLEVRYLANQDANLFFVLLTDFPDADQESLPGDSALLDLARAEIRRLNQRHAAEPPERFMLLHRPRKWNAREGVWMGEERKRGKLSALNRLLRTGSSAAFSVAVGDLAAAGPFPYVITLDTDTLLPRDVARELAGAMAHPLNRPRVDPRSRLVVEGHAILQPRVATTIPDANRSLYSRLFGGDAGIDPYTSQTSDVYQDLFGEGSFIGKGIYDVRAFETAVEGRFPDNRVLSHDLIEGCYARGGLVNDVELFEGVPSRLLADMSRRHRWIRGDWQIAAWLRPGALGTRNGPANRLPGLACWKIFDNLHRSLSPIFLLGFLVLGWGLGAERAAVWTLLAAGIVFGPAMIGVLPSFLRRPEEKPWRLHFRDQAGVCRRSLAREAIGGCVLPYTVHCHLDAILRTLFRLHVSRRKLLEWTTACDAEHRSRGNVRDHYEVMWACPVAALAAAALLAVTQPAALAGAAPVLLAWLAGPAVAWAISRPRSRKVGPLGAAQKRQFGRWARQTWHYFESFVGEEDHWLPPDNVHERGQWTATPRTSPTNFGLALLAELAAYDLGYQPASALLERTGRTLRAMQSLDRHDGHFFNWYDTRTLQPIEPRYVSTVDSGNLWAALTVLRCGLEELPDGPLAPPRMAEGLQDALEAIAAVRPRGPAWSGFHDALERLSSRCAEETGGGERRAAELLAGLCAAAAELDAAVPHEARAMREWTRSLLGQIGAAREDLARLAFWTRLPPCAAWKRKDLDPSLAGEIGPLLADVEAMDGRLTLGQLPRAADEVARRADRLLAALGRRNGSAGASAGETGALLVRLREAALLASAAVGERLRNVTELAALCRQLSKMDFRFLFDSQRSLFSIGFHVGPRRRDDSFYDLLASESRLTSYLAIIHGQVPPTHWFALGRMVALADGEPVLLSWSGSMFEYLLPALLMPSHPGTMLEASCRVAVRRQIRYARRRGVPWGISESCYHLTDAQLAYQYRAFGVPGLGLDRGLGDQLVVAPYASAMAAVVSPREAGENLALLERLGYLSPYGFYDAIDYTPQRRPSAGAPGVCRTVMAHHSGMTLLALANLLADRPMPHRFQQDPLCRSHDLLLQERISQNLRPIRLDETGR